MTAEQREFDIVLYGATGFVGKLTAENLAKAGGGARIALAGAHRKSCSPCARPSARSRSPGRS